MFEARILPFVFCLKPVGADSPTETNPTLFRNPTGSGRDHCILPTTKQHLPQALAGRQKQSSSIMHTTTNKTSSLLLLLPPIPTATFTKAVPHLINFFEGLDTTVEESSSDTMSRIPAPFPSPFTALRTSLTTSFNHPQRVHTTQSSTDSTTSSTTTSASASPQSSFRGAAFTRSRTWTTTRTRSRSPRSLHSYTNSPVLLSRRPSATDLALLEEESLSQNVKGVGLGLGLMEPRPIVAVPVAIAASSSIFDGPTEEDAEQRQPFVMGGILEVMEGRS